MSEAQGSGAEHDLSMGPSNSYWMLLLVQASVRGQVINVHMQLNKKLTCENFPFLPVPGDQTCVTAGDIMAEVNASSPAQIQETGAVMGRVLFHALRGQCIVSRLLPNETFFLDYMLNHLGLENFTTTGIRPSGRGEQKYGCWISSSVACVWLVQV